MPYVLLYSDTKTVLSVFGSPQPPDIRPDGYAEIAATDPRWAAWQLMRLAGQVRDAAAIATTAVTAQVVPNQTYQLAYSNAAPIVWANGGSAPSTDPAKTIFQQQGASVGIPDPAKFAKVVAAVSLGSMQLSTILGALTAAADAAKAPADLATALAAFEAALNDFITTLNDQGLTVTVSAPPPIIVPGVNG